MAKIPQIAGKAVFRRNIKKETLNATLEGIENLFKSKIAVPSLNPSPAMVIGTKFTSITRGYP